MQFGPDRLTIEKSCSGSELVGPTKTTKIIKARYRARTMKGRLHEKGGKKRPSETKWPSNISKNAKDDTPQAAKTGRLANENENWYPTKRNPCWHWTHAHWRPRVGMLPNFKLCHDREHFCFEIDHFGICKPTLSSFASISSFCLLVGIFILSRHPALSIWHTIGLRSGKSILSNVKLP